MSDIPKQYDPLTILRKILNPEISGSFQSLPLSFIDGLSLRNSFNYIKTIRASVIAKHGNDENLDIPIDEDLIPNELATLLQLQKKLTLSDEYQDFVANVTQEAADRLCDDVSFVSNLVNWKTKTSKQRLDLCREFHKAIIHVAKERLMEFSGFEPMAQAIEPMSINATFTRPIPFGDEDRVLINQGAAATNHLKAPGCEYITMNTHPKATLKEALTAMSTVAHETAHVIEGLFAFMHGHNPNFIPPIFQKDAEILFTRLDCDARIPSSIFSAYAEQSNEKMARDAGDVALKAFRKTMMRHIKSSSAVMMRDIHAHFDTYKIQHPPNGQYPTYRPSS